MFNAIKGVRASMRACCGRGQRRAARARDSRTVETRGDEARATSSNALGFHGELVPDPCKRRLRVLVLCVGVRGAVDNKAAFLDRPVIKRKRPLAKSLVVGKPAPVLVCCESKFALAVPLPIHPLALVLCACGGVRIDPKAVARIDGPAPSVSVAVRISVLAGPGPFVIRPRPLSVTIPWVRRSTDERLLPWPAVGNGISKEHEEADSD